MTKEETISELRYIADEMPSMECADWLEAISMAIKALEREDILDKIITRIEQTRDKDKLCEYPYNRCIRILKEEFENDKSNIKI